MTSKLKFHYSNDGFVNEAIAEIAVRISNRNDMEVDVYESRIVIKGEAPVQAIESLILEEFSTNTHRRSSIARYYTANSVGTDIKPVSEPFPEEHDVMGESIESSDLESIGISDVDGNMSSNVGQSIYTLNPFYTGDPTNRKTSRLRRYLDALKKENFRQYEPDNRCRCCSRSDLPNWKYDGEDIEYNQQFSHHVTKSGQTALGQKGSQDTTKRGRCVACLIAGYTYTLIEKPFYTTEDRDYRIFSVRGDFEALYNVRKDYESVLADVDAELDDSDPRYKILSSNIPTRARSDEGQLLSLLCRLLDSYTERSHGEDLFDEPELAKRIDGAVVYTSSNSKGGNPVRGITSMRRYELLDNIYDYIKPIEYEFDQGNETLKKKYRVGSLIESLSAASPEFGTGDRLNRSVGEFSKGIMNEESMQIESGLFGIAKPVVNQSAYIPKSSINILGSRKYMKVLFNNMTELTEEEIESISSVGSSFGRMFDTRDDVSILISLKNANDAGQFLEALEKAGMEGMKKSIVRDEHVGEYDVVWNENLETTIKTLSDDSKFKHAKNILVSHASLSALYNNVKSESDNGDNQ